MKKTIIAILAIAIVVLVGKILWSTPETADSPQAGNKAGQTDADGGTAAMVEVTRTMDGKQEKRMEPAAPVRSVERRPLEPEATKRLHDGPVVVTSVFEASGNATYAQYGQVTKGVYYYVTTVRARSEVTEKNEGPDGSIRVVERREFLQAQDQLSLSELDVALDLSTLPVKEVQTLANGLCDGVAWISGILGAPEVLGGTLAAKTAINSGFSALHDADGKSFRALLGYFGVEDIPEDLEVFLNQLASEWAKTQVAPVHSLLQSIEGKTFVITYTQDAAGKPLNVDFRHEEGNPISKSEWEILRCANAFLDANIVTDARCRVGDRWTVWADEFSDIFGLSGNDKTDGKIRVVRDDDQANGDWTLRIEPSEIAYRGAQGAGKLELQDGTGLVDAANVSVKAIQVSASGDINMLDKERYWMFFEFVKKSGGDASMRFTLSTEPADRF